MPPEDFWNQLSTPLKYIIVFYPIAIALLTVTFSSILTFFTKRKDRRLENRPYFSYTEYILSYPITDSSHGEGVLLLGENGKKLFPIGSRDGSSKASFMVLKNLSSNDVLNAEIVVKYSDSGEYLKEKFNLPIWKKDEAIYLTQSIYGKSIFSTNERLVITFNSTALEKLRFTYKRKRYSIYNYRFVKSSKFKYKLVRKYKSHYIEKYQKRIFFLWFNVFTNCSKGLTRVASVIFISYISTWSFSGRFALKSMRLNQRKPSN